MHIKGAGVSENLAWQRPLEDFKAAFVHPYQAAMGQPTPCTQFDHQGAVHVRGFTRFRCPGCGTSALFQFGADETQIRCVRCRATSISLSLLPVLTTRVGSLEQSDAFEASSRGPVVNFLRKRCRSLETSEFFPDVALGAFKAGVQCQDLQQLTVADGAFHLCTSTEVFEHVADDLAAFRELRRVLRPGGLLVFTVPLGGSPSTTVRAQIAGGIQHLLPQTFHGDRLSGRNRVLVFRDYGADILTRLLSVGFQRAEFVDCRARWRGFGRQVIIAVA